MGLERLGENLGRHIRIEPQPQHTRGVLPSHKRACAKRHYGAGTARGEDLSRHIHIEPELKGVDLHPHIKAADQLYNRGNVHYESRVVKLSRLKL